MAAPSGLCSNHTPSLTIIRQRWCRYNCKGLRSRFSSGFEDAFPIPRHYRIPGCQNDMRYLPCEFRTRQGLLETAVHRGKGLRSGVLLVTAVLRSFSWLIEIRLSSAHYVTAVSGFSSEICSTHWPCQVQGVQLVPWVSTVATLVMMGSQGILPLCLLSSLELSKFVHTWPFGILASAATAASLVTQFVVDGARSMSTSYLSASVSADFVWNNDATGWRRLHFKTFLLLYLLWHCWSPSTYPHACCSFLQAHQSWSDQQWCFYNILNHSANVTQHTDGPSLKELHDSLFNKFTYRRQIFFTSCLTSPPMNCCSGVEMDSSPWYGLVPGSAFCSSIGAL